jgi:hypothetical protein
MNSLKRKKSTAASGNKAATKRIKKASYKHPIASSQAINASPTPIPSLSLDHLIDRPYVEYESNKDDIGTLPFLSDLIYSFPGIGM